MPNKKRPIGDQKVSEISSVAEQLEGCFNTAEFSRLKKVTSELYGVKIPGDDHEAIMTMLELFIKHQDNDSCEALFCLRIPFEQAAAKALHHDLNKAGQEYEIDGCRQALEAVLSSMEALDEASGEQCVDLDANFHKAIARYYRRPEIANFIQKLQSHHSSIDILRHKDVVLFYQSHLKLFSLIFNLEATDEEIDAAVDDHIRAGARSWEALGRQSDLLSVKGHMEVGEMNNQLLLESLLDEYRERAEQLFDDADAVIDSLQAALDEELSTTWRELTPKQLDVKADSFLMDAFSKGIFFVVYERSTNEDGSRAYSRIISKHSDWDEACTTVRKLSTESSDPSRRFRVFEPSDMREPSCN